MHKTATKTATPRPPIVVIMGHIDHGKSSLLDYIRKTNVVAKEAGGITQHLSAYEVARAQKTGKADHITFLDTPGHQAFSKMRSRGANVADIAVLVVSAEDGVKEQTKEALRAILDAHIPYIVAINKIDKPNANIERTKQNLAENEIYLEGFGGDIPFVPISAKIGTGVPELLDMILLVAELENLTANTDDSAEGIVIESHITPAQGISSTLIITNGTLKKGSFILADKSITPVRAIENFLSEKVESATFSAPVKITGFDGLPSVGAMFHVYASKKEAEAARDAQATKSTKGVAAPQARTTPLAPNALIIPIILKSDVGGTLEALEKELGKIEHERVVLKFVSMGVGAIGENDVKLASGAENPIILGFHVKVDRKATEIAERFNVTVKTFDIIYELSEWIEAEMVRRAPKVFTEEITGTVKILKIFGASKHKQVIGGKVTSGVIEQNSNIKIMRRGVEIGQGKIVEIQTQKIPAKKVDEGNECGMMVETKIEITPSDTLEACRVTEK
ncbi:MAG: translation initiation factor IF-2 [Patescibacteria group bacterium]